MCAFFTVVLKQAQFSLILTFSMITVLRILYITWWKNVGALNDDFFLCFARALNPQCILLFSSWLLVFQKYKGFPDYIVCVGNDSLNPELAFDPIDLVIRTVTGRFHTGCSHTGLLHTDNFTHGHFHTRTLGRYGSILNVVEMTF